MTKIDLVDAGKINFWKERIVALLQSQFKGGITDKDIGTVYRDVPEAIILQAFAELVVDGTCKEIT